MDARGRDEGDAGGKGAIVRRELVEAAIRVLGAEGPDAVQARRLTREIGASTMAVYHWFGGMPTLLGAVSDEGFRRLDAALGAVPLTDDPIADIDRLARAYRLVARENPHLYDLMFGLAAPGGHRPDLAHGTREDTRSPAADAYGHLVDAARRAIAAGRLAPGEPTLVAAQLWSQLHGYVALELAGHFAHLTDPVTDVLTPMTANLLTGLGA